MQLMYKFSQWFGLQSLFHKLGLHVTRRVNVVCLEPLLYRRLKKTGKLFFVQVGANDGVFRDPLFEFVTSHHDQVSGLALEPMRETFQQLQANYAKFPHVTPVNAAIHTTEKQLDIYKVDPDYSGKLPEWVRGIASFDPEHHKSLDVPAEAIITESVRCLTFDELLSEYDVEHIDLLQIDTEGYDAEIIKSIDFSKTRPSIIRFEHNLEAGNMQASAFIELADLLHQQGYDVILETQDATAYQLEAVL
jgi:FkbM family methyltransferase